MLAVNEEGEWWVVIPAIARYILYNTSPVFPAHPE